MGDYFPFEIIAVKDLREMKMLLLVVTKESISDGIYMAYLMVLSRGNLAGCKCLLLAGWGMRSGHGLLRA